MRSKYRNIAFLAELLVNIFVFSISCAILAGLFGQAGMLATQTREEGFASTEMHALFEITKARGLEGLGAECEETSDGFVCYYDRQWNAADPSAYEYTIQMDVQEEETGAGVLYRLNATASHSSGREICQMQTAVYSSDKGGVAL